MTIMICMRRHLVKSFPLKKIRLLFQHRHINPHLLEQWQLQTPLQALLKIAGQLYQITRSLSPQYADLSLFST